MNCIGPPHSAHEGHEVSVGAAGAPPTRTGPSEEASK
jgi:hypothetical protein